MVMHYIPILKDKAGELGALAELDDDAKIGLTPLFDLVEPEQEPDPWIQNRAKALNRAWKISRPVYVDGLNIGALKTSTGERALVALVRVCNDTNVNVVPVTGLGRSPDYQAAVREILKKRPEFGLCLRLAGNDFDEEFPTDAISGLLRDLKHNEENIDLLIDLGVGQAAGPIGAYLRSIPSLSKWRTVTLAATSFPEHLGEFGPDSVTLVPRSEWKTWTSLRKSKLARMPQFSDYAIQHPKLVKFEKKMRLSAGLRYTADNDWLIVRGRSVKKWKYEQMHGLCAKLVARPEFKGAEFSSGDRWIAICAARKVTPGNPATWRKVGTVHHLTMVVHQLASLLETSGDFLRAPQDR